MTIKLIHIGKCGGTTVSSILNANNIVHENIHITKPIFNVNDKYLIVIRNPINRFISAFNWRYKLVVMDKTQETRFLNEKNILTNYDCINNLAENIEEFDINNTYIHHIYENIDFYLSDFLTNCKKENIIGVVTQENLNNDVEKIFNLNLNYHVMHNKNDTKTDTYLSTIGYELLKKYLHKEYECVDKLFELGCLSNQQYDILSK